MAVTQEHTDAELESDSIKQQFAETFGDIEPPESDRFDYSDCVIGSDNVILWSPGKDVDPSGLEFAGYTDVDNVTVKYAPIDGEVRRVYVFHNGDRSHVADAGKVDKLAEIVGESPENFIQSAARTHTKYPHHTVQFELPDGEALIAPVVVGDDEMSDTPEHAE